MAERPSSDDIRDQDEPDEIEEIEDHDLGLDSEVDPAPAFFERPWFKYASFALAALVVGSLLLPVLAIFFNGSGGSNDDITIAPPQVPLFELPAASGGTVNLVDVAQRHTAVVVVFYRGFF